MKLNSIFQIIIRIFARHKKTASENKKQKNISMSRPHNGKDNAVLRITASSMYKKITSWIFDRNALPYWCILLADCGIVVFSAILCIVIDRGPNIELFSIGKTLCLYLLFYILGFRIMRTYKGVLRYSSFVDLYRIGIAMFIGTVLVASMRTFFHSDEWFAPIRYRELLGIFVIGTALMWALRVFVKYVYDHFVATNTAKRVFIYGVKRGGIGLAKNINSEEPKKYSLCGFVSDEGDMVGKILMGVKVHPRDSQLIPFMKHHEIQALLVSPLKQDAFVNDVNFVDALIDAGIAIYTIDPAEKWDGKSDLNAKKFREVEIEDLLPRDEIKVDLGPVAGMLKGKSVLITGAAGSIGSEILKKVAQFNPGRIVSVDEAETPSHDIRLMMRREFPEVKCQTIVTTICRKERMENIFKTYRPDYVFHAAAYKHVPMMEDNPCEAVENNIDGTRIVADLAVKYGTKKFVMISTDKAVNPTNVMGCSKRICEIYVQSLNRAQKDGLVQGHTQFVTTRFGNVLGSNGSVIPLFREQIKAGGPVTVTHPDVIRYFMLTPEACKLVLEAGTMGKGGEIFVFDMGKPVKISDLAHRMIRLSGMVNVKVEYTGLRDGEKLYEEVLNDEELTIPTFNPKIKVAKVREYNYEEVAKAIDDLVKTSYEFDRMKVVKKMKAIVPEYISKHSVYEQLDCN